ncbi:hypothetical protein CAPTEDRAFT_222069 [Capitella teleta]|uniref:EF-hand domain-containing protein n=1 Tax=Capitella teleta TaxID=283909 RepID=R7TIZ8_CAPTE|nr:hypothetical protein CAPTEDRAFT_222069 [Capitella teleta]|eukprot:ELT91521.1 hypothetical protein CAPTEDRAFT_222069 [Capitella teleta]
MGCSSSRSSFLDSSSRRISSVTEDRRSTAVTFVCSEHGVEAEIAEEPKSEREKRDSVDSDMFVNEEEALAYVQQELDVDLKKAEAVLETIQKSQRGVSSLDLVLINAKIKEVKETLEPKFAEYDPSNTGFVSPDDAIAIMQQEFAGLPYATIQSMVQRYDKDKNNKVDFGEFILFYSCVKAKKDQLEERFDELDKDHSGDLQTEELCEILVTECGLKEIQARMLIEDFDVDRNGSIDRFEFNLMWTKIFE